MAHKIIIDGEIGWEVTAETVRSQIKEAKGQDLDIELSSPGGSVFEGITIYNLIKNYAGHTSITISGLAASMGSYIALAGDELTISENSVYMIHNAWGFSGGDHKELKKTANLLESLTGLLNKAYVSKTGKSTEEIKNLMDEESWFFGSEIVEAGFADSLIESESKEEREEAVLSAMLKVEACSLKLKEEEKKQDLEKAAALFKAPVAKTQTKQEEEMTPEEIQALQEKLAKTETALAEATAKITAEDGKQSHSHAQVEEPVAEVANVNALALTVLKSDSYHAKVKEIAANVLEGKAEAVTLEAVVAVTDMQTEELKSLQAQKESGKLGETPGEQPKDLGVDKDGKATSVAGILAMGQKIKDDRKENK